MPILDDLRPTFVVVAITLVLLPALPGRAVAQNLGNAEIQSVVDSAIALITTSYVYDERKPQIVEHLRARLNAGHYYEFPTPDSLANRLTADMRSISTDMHLYVERAAQLPRNPSDHDAWAERERINEKVSNFGFTDARVLAGNVGYLRIVEFMHPQRGYEAAASAMRFLSNTEALVIDLRGNGGGYGGLMELVLSYFFDPAPTHISTTFTSDEEAPPTPTFTLPFVPGPRRVGQPLYVLVGPGTGSAAEFFAYTLQSFDKAIVVGERSAGAAHRNTYYELDHGLRISISTGACSPISTPHPRPLRASRTASRCMLCWRAPRMDSSVSGLTRQSAERSAREPAAARSSASVSAGHGRIRAGTGHSGARSPRQEERNTHVDAPKDPFADAGSIPAGSPRSARAFLLPDQAHRAARARAGGSGSTSPSAAAHAPTSLGTWRRLRDRPAPAKPPDRLPRSRP